LVVGWSRALRRNESWRAIVTPPGKPAGNRPAGLVLAAIVSFLQ